MEVFLHIFAQPAVLRNASNMSVPNDKLSKFDLVYVLLEKGKDSNHWSLLIINLLIKKKSEVDWKSRF